MLIACYDRMAWYLDRHIRMVMTRLQFMRENTHYSGSTNHGIPIVSSIDSMTVSRNASDAINSTTGLASVASFAFPPILLRSSERDSVACKNISVCTAASIILSSDSLPSDRSNESGSCPGGSSANRN